MSEPQRLPTGWEWATLGDVTEPVDQRGPNDGTTFQYVDIGAVDNAAKLITGTKTLPIGDAPSRARQNLRTGDVLVSMTRPNLNAVALVRQALDGAVASTGFHVLRARHVDPRWVFAAVRAPEFVGAMTQLVQGALYPAVRPADVRAYRLPIPPAAEQRRIVAKLDELLVSSRAARAALDAVPAQVPHYVRAFLAAAFDGRLTADVRARTTGDASAELLTVSQRREVIWSALLHDQERLRRRIGSGRVRRAPEAVKPDLSHHARELPHGWTVASVGQLALCLDSFRVPVKREQRGAVGTTYPYFGANGRVGEISDYIFDLDMVLVTEDETFYGRTKPIAYRVREKCWVNNHAHVLVPLPRYTTEFLHYALMYYDVEPWLSGTTGRAKLTQADLLRLPILVPPLHEREELCRRIRNGLATIESVRHQVADSIVKLQELEDACIAKAFRGELVPQDPTDEHASSLLDRIRAERADAPRQRPRRRISRA